MSNETGSGNWTKMFFFSFFLLLAIPIISADNGDSYVKFIIPYTCPNGVCEDGEDYLICPLDCPVPAPGTSGHPFIDVEHKLLARACNKDEVELYGKCYDWTELKVRGISMEEVMNSAGALSLMMLYSFPGYVWLIIILTCSGIFLFLYYRRKAKEELKKEESGEPAEDVEETEETTDDEEDRT